MRFTSVIVLWFEVLMRFTNDILNATPTKDIQGNILGGYYIGYIMTQIFGAWLARKIGSVKVLAASMTIG